MLSPQGPQWSRHSVARADVATIVHPHVCGYNSGKCGETRNSVSLSGEKMEWESPPSILVTRNPNWSQRSGTETDCVKGRY